MREGRSGNIPLQPESGMDALVRHTLDYIRKNGRLVRHAVETHSRIQCEKIINLSLESSIAYHERDHFRISPFLFRNFIAISWSDISSAIMALFISCISLAVTCPDKRFKASSRPSCFSRTAFLIKVHAS